MSQKTVEMKKIVISIGIIIVAAIGVWTLFKLTRSAVDRPVGQTPEQIVKPKGALMSGDYTRALTVGGLNRTYLVHVPKSYDGTKVFPVVLIFHGGGSNAKQWVVYSGLNETAERSSFIAVYPNGTGEITQDYEVFGWNGGQRQPGGKDPKLANVDDVEFTRTMLDDLAGVLKIDDKRIYATGMSLGGIMTYRLASELSDRIAAIAPIAAVMGTETSNPKRPVPVIHFHGTQDEAVPFKGGKGKLDPSRTDFYSVDYSIQAWVEADGCNTQPIIETLPNKADDGTTIIRQTYVGCKQNSEVVLIKIEGGGHTWPGRETGQGLKILGKSTKDISANDLMWDFFQKHPMR